MKALIDALHYMSTRSADGEYFAWEAGLSVTLKRNPPPLPLNALLFVGGLDRFVR